MSVSLAAAAERAVVGCMLSDGNAIDELTQHLSPEDFQDPVLAELFRACQQARAMDRTTNVDWLTVATTAWETGTVRRLGPKDLNDLATAAPGLHGARRYARAVRDLSMARKMRAVAAAAVQSLDAGEHPTTVLQTTNNGLAEATRGMTRKGVELKDYRDLMAEEDAPYDWVVPGFLERRDRLVLTGVEGFGKSVLLRQAAILTACGLNFLTGKPIPPQRVLVVDVENTEKQWRRTTSRMYQACKDLGVDVGDRLKVSCTGRIDITSGQDLSDIHRAIDEHDPDLITMGALYKMTPKGITNDDDAAPVITALDSIRDRGITMVMESHMGHAKATTGIRDPRPRGSSALLGWPEFGVSLVPVANDASEGQNIPGLMDFVHWRGQRDPRPWPQQLIHGPGSRPWEPLDPIEGGW